MLSVDLMKQHVRPFLFSVELRHRVRCALDSIETTCRALRSIWSDDASTEDAVIIHTQDVIDVRGGVSRSDLHIYVHAALSAIVVHPLRVGPRDIRRISGFNHARHQSMPEFAPHDMLEHSPHNIISITSIAQFTFQHQDVSMYFHGAHMCTPLLFSTGHWISTGIDECEVRIALLRLAICDLRRNGKHVLWAQVPFLELADLHSSRLVEAEKFSRVTAVYFGADFGDDGDWISSTAFTNSIPLDYLYYQNCCERGVTAVLGRVNQERADWKIDALVRVNVVMWDDDEWFTDYSLKVSPESVAGEVVELHG